MEVWIRPSYYYLPKRNERMPFPVPGWMWDRSFGVGLYDEHMRFIRRMDSLGFDGILFTEHHYGPNGGITPSPTVFLSAATQVTERIKLVTMGIPLALYPQPVRVAEELAMLDNLSHGRLVAGFISGGAQSLYAYDVAAEEERERYHEAYDLVLKAWTEENPFPWHGRYYHYPCVSILPRPLQSPHPPVWTVATSAESLQWAARHRIRLIGSGTLQGATETLNYYKDYAGTHCGWTPASADLGISREIYIGPTQSEVREKIHEVFNREGDLAYSKVFEAPELANLQRAIRSLRSQPRPAPGERNTAERRSQEGLRSGRYLAGDPDSVTEQILQQRTVSGAGVLVIRPELGEMSLDDVTKSMELFAREVLPVVKKA